MEHNLKKSEIGGRTQLLCKQQQRIQQTKKSTDANYLDCSEWRDPVYTEEWIDHPLSTENMLTLLEGMEQTEAKRGSSAGTGVTGMSVPTIAAGLPTTLEKVQESLDEGNVEEEGQ